MSQIHWVGKPCEHVCDRRTREPQKIARWCNPPKQKTPVDWVNVKMYVQCALVTVACVAALFFTWFYAGM